ncbi:MAG: hypothetical protein U9Q15_05665 [Patescibacteria group bacterium]|nr:hypothetical protein [Patescibacteria group bacterium]
MKLSLQNVKIISLPIRMNGEFEKNGEKIAYDYFYVLAQSRSGDRTENVQLRYLSEKDCPKIEQVIPSMDITFF